MEARDRGRGRTATDWLGARELAPLVARIGGNHGLSAADCADVVQETRIALWQTDPARAIARSWISAVAKNKSVGMIRRNARIQARERGFARFEVGTPPDPDLDYLLHVRVARLPERLRRFYELHYVAGWSERELARKLGVCRASVRWLDRCCRRTLLGQSTHG